VAACKHIFKVITEFLHEPTMLVVAVLTL